MRRVSIPGQFSLAKERSLIRSRCDSYNTAQIQILSGPDPQISLAQNAEAAAHPPESSDPVVPVSSGTYTPSRGRHARGVPSSHLNPPSSSQRRPTSSASVVTETVRFSPYPVPQRTGRSVSPLRSFGGDLNAITVAAVEEAELMNTDDEEDGEEEVDFWGGDGSRSRSRSAVRVGEEESSAEDDDDSIEDDYEDIEEDGDDGDGNDQMELLGHR